jgi:hypothetical protein
MGGYIPHHPPLRTPLYVPIMRRACVPSQNDEFAKSCAISTSISIISRVRILRQMPLFSFFYFLLNYQFITIILKMFMVQINKTLQRHDDNL